MVTPKNPVRHLLRRLSGRQGHIDDRYITAALDYIDGHWEQLTRSHTEDSGTIIGLPKPYVVPANDTKAKFTFQEQYYWDSYITAIGLVGKHQKLAEGMLDNLVYIFKRFHFIPNASRMYYMSRSQPPVLTSYIKLIYETGHKDKTWLREYMETAHQEYERVWVNETHPFWHKVYKGLSRYYDINLLHDLAEAESGWDMTPRFERKCLDYLPIDLNSLLYKYEIDFAWAAEILDEKDQVRHWKNQAKKRQHQTTNLMWHKRKGFFFDYNYAKEQIGDVWSLAGFYPMWAGLATTEQAAQMVKNLSKFEHSGGLSTTTQPLIDMSIFGSLKSQWAYPNGWAPLHQFVIEGLENYGYHNEANRIARKWIETNLGWFECNGVFLEKYNVVKPKKPPLEGVYPSQTGFGWTNAVFVDLSKKYLAK